MSEKFSAILLMGFLVGMLVVGMATNSDFWGYVTAQISYGSGQVVVVELPEFPLAPAPADTPEQRGNSKSSVQKSVQKSLSAVVRATSLQ